MSTLTNSERQAIFRKRMQQKGYVQTTVYVPKKYRKRLSRIIKEIQELYELERSIARKRK